jgi:hypothetical protein
MKLLINHVLATNNATLFDGVTEILSHYAVSHKIEDGILTIEPQKITLDSVDLNHLLYDGISVLFDVNFHYVGLGGEGCDLCLKIDTAAPIA